jgi:hypothetical protein
VKGVIYNIYDLSVFKSGFISGIFKDFKKHFYFLVYEFSLGFKYRISFITKKNDRLDDYFRYCRTLQHRLVDMFAIKSLVLVTASVGVIYPHEFLVFVSPFWCKIGCYVSDFLKEFSLYSCFFGFRPMNLLNFTSILGYFLNFDVLVKTFKFILSELIVFVKHIISVFTYLWKSEYLTTGLVWLRDFMNYGGIVNWRIRFNLKGTKALSLILVNDIRLKF